MEAETDLSPPVPEPEVHGHGDRGWEADMMSALGESVSFGRFLSEPLDWGKWSAFQHKHKRYREEAARHVRPGTVAQKKAMLEAHYARKRRAGAEGDHEFQGSQGKDLWSGNLVSTGAADELKQRRGNQDVTDSAKKRRLHRLGSPSSGKKGQSSSAKRRSAPYSSKENASPPPSTDSSKRKRRPVHWQGWTRPRP